jgi:hypothetical protein
LILKIINETEITDSRPCHFPFVLSGDSSGNDKKLAQETTLRKNNYRSQKKKIIFRIETPGTENHFASPHAFVPARIWSGKNKEMND